MENHCKNDECDKNHEAVPFISTDTPIDEVGYFLTGLRKEDKDQLNRIESRLDRIEFKLHLILSHDSTGPRTNDRGIIVARDMMGHCYL